MHEMLSIASRYGMFPTFIGGMCHSDHIKNTPQGLPNLMTVAR